MVRKLLLRIGLCVGSEEYVHRMIWRSPNSETVCSSVSTTSVSFT